MKYFLFLYQFTPKQPQTNSQTTMSYINYSDLAPESHRNSVNRFKKNKGLKYSRTEKHAESKFWKRAKRIRLHKQSREDNYVGETFPDFEYDDKTPPEVLSSPPDDFVAAIEDHDFYDSSTIKVYKIYAENDDYKSKHDIDILGDACTHVDTNIVTLKLEIDSALASFGALFQFDYDGACWECLTQHHHFILRMFIVEFGKEKSIVLEKTLLRGNRITFFNTWVF